MAEHKRWVCITLALALVAAGFLLGALFESRSTDEARGRLAACEDGLQTEKLLAYNKGVLEMSAACRADVAHIIESFTPDVNCSLVQVNPNYTIETCDGDELYSQIQTAKEQIDQEWNRAAKEGRLIRPVIT